MMSPGDPDGVPHTLSPCLSGGQDHLGVCKATPPARREPSRAAAAARGGCPRGALQQCPYLSSSHLLGSVWS